MRFAAALILLLALPTSASAQWTRLETGLPDTYAPTQLLHHAGATYAVMTASPPLQSRLLRSADEGNTWTALPNFPEAAFNSRLFFYAVGDELVTWTENGRDGTVVVLRSADHGDTWTNRELTGISSPWYSVLKVGTTVLVGNGGALLRSTDGMQTFARIAGAPAEVTRLVDGGSALVAQSSSGMLYRSTDGGDTWTNFRVGLTGVGRLWQVGTTLYVKTSFSSIYTSTDAGGAWTEQVPTYGPTTWSGAYPTGGGTGWMLGNAPYDVFTSTDGGQTATSVSATLPKVSSGFLCAAELPSGTSAYFAAVNDPTRSCTGGTTGLYRYRPSEGVAADDVPHPDAPALSVSPNPATGPVAVAVTLARAATARIAVYDVLGREVARLHDGALGAGTHRFVWANDVPSGIYLVRSIADDASVVRTVVRR